MKLTKPRKPVPYSRTNYPNRQDYEQQMRVYEQALAIYIAFGGKL